MNIIEALKSNKRIKRKDWDNFGTDVTSYLMKSDILAEDWETEDFPVTFTREQFCEAWERAIDQNGGQDVVDAGFLLRHLVAKELGL